MKRIILIRHAKVESDNTQKIDTHALKNWIYNYDTAPIASDSLPTKETLSLVHNADVVVTSTLRRAIDSANVLGVEIHEKNSLFNEVGIPDVHLPFLKLRPKAWLVILRVLLLLKLGKQDKTFKVSKARSLEATQRLLILTKKYENVVLVGHGGMNWLIRKALMKEGWVLDGKPSNANWGVTVLQVS